MTTAMLAAGWAPIRNLWGRITHWRHENGTVMSHALALTHWREHGNTPPPF